MSFLTSCIREKYTTAYYYASATTEKRKVLRSYTSCQIKKKKAKIISQFSLSQICKFRDLGTVSTKPYIEGTNVFFPWCSLILWPYCHFSGDLSQAKIFIPPRDCFAGGWSLRFFFSSAASEHTNLSPRGIPKKELEHKWKNWIMYPPVSTKPGASCCSATE